MSDDEKWIYETPDGGRTVIRRPINNFDPIYKDYKFSENTKDLWTNYITIGKMFKEFQEEEKLREQYPALQEKYNEYRALLEICRDPKKDD